jgi:hypothetical protein
MLNLQWEDEMTDLERAAQAARDQRVADDRAAGLHHIEGRDQVLPEDIRIARAILKALGIPLNSDAAKMA